MPRRSSSQLRPRSDRGGPPVVARERSSPGVSFGDRGVIAALLAGIAPAWPSGRPDRPLESASGPHDPIRGDLDGQGWQGPVRRATHDPRVRRWIEHAGMAGADDIPLLAQPREDGTAKVRADGAVGDQPSRQIRGETDELDQIPLVVALPLGKGLYRHDRFNRRDVDWESRLVAGGVYEQIAGGDLLDLAGEGAESKGREEQSQAERPGPDPDCPTQNAPACGEPFLVVRLPIGEIALLTCLKIRVRWASVRRGLYHGTPSSRSSNRASSP